MGEGNAQPEDVGGIYGYKEVLKVVINYLFFDLKKHRITASVEPNITKSIRLLEKLGVRK